ncbi:hypothetical protein RJT34_12475 [Clitoria ternatea]|uniref:MMS19 nucleotide excision repair protein n=1 Tax=Clitoria ternatea TaxID=43366 RepID=A0AAN9PLE8_CLITE
MVKVAKKKDLKTVVPNLEPVGLDLLLPFVIPLLLEKLSSSLPSPKLGSGDSNMQRDSLSRSLMSAFSSMTLFEPIVIPLLLEKLSSSLPSAKFNINELSFYL